MKNKHVYVDYGGTEDIPEDVWSWDSIEIWQDWTEVGE